MCIKKNIFQLIKNMCNHDARWLRIRTAEKILTNYVTNYKGKVRMYAS
jgi:hypothetical protein